jgi:hypothetical protein
MVMETNVAMLLIPKSAGVLAKNNGARSWKSHDWDAMERLHEKGYISNPRSKAKSVVMTEEGAKRAQELFEKHFMSGARSARQR